MADRQHQQYQSRLLVAGSRGDHGTSAADASLPPLHRHSTSGYVPQHPSHHAPVVGADAAVMRGLSAPMTHFEEEVVVLVRQLDREEVSQPLGVALTSGQLGTVRCVSVRLTDPRDPFFLYSMTLSEDDYGKFKEAHELHVDWNGFPQDLIALLSGGFPGARAAGNASEPAVGLHDRSTGSVGGPRGVTLRFTTSGPGGQQGLLRIMEPTAFREIELLRLNLAKQGDVGQKQYLAERFKFFEAEYHACYRDRADDNARAAKDIAQLRDALADAHHERDQLRARLEREASASGLQHSTVVMELKDAHAAEIRKLYAEMERERAAQEDRVAGIKANADETRATLAGALEAETATGRKLGAELKEAKRQIAELENTTTSQARELASLKGQHAELSAFKLEAVKDRTQRELREATMEERIRYFEQSARERVEELNSLRQQHEAQKQYGAHFKEQLDAANAKIANLDGQLADARKLFVHNTETIDGLKEKVASLTSEVKHLEALASEKTLAAERAKQESALAAERLEMANAKVEELRGQLRELETTKSTLAGQLKQNEDALLHMQRLSSGAGPRQWTARAANVDASLASGAAASLAGKYATSTFVGTAHQGATASSIGGGLSRPTSYTPPAAMPSHHATGGLLRDFARGAAGFHGVTPAASTTAAPHRSASASSAHATAGPADVPHNGAAAAPSGQHNVSLGHRGGAAGMFSRPADTSSVASYGFDFGADKPHTAANRRETTGVPTSAYFPSLDE